MANFSTEDASFEQETSYATILYAPHKTNKNCYFAVLLLKENLYHQGSKKMEYIKEWRQNVPYLAFCEGDDYWIHPKKLQMQTDFLDEHKDYGMCYSNFNIHYQKSGKTAYSLFTTASKNFPMNYTLEQFICRAGYVCPPSWVYRKELGDTYVPIKGSCDGTFVMFVHFLATSKVYAFKEVFATYRSLEESASHSRDITKVYDRVKNILYVQKQLALRYNLSGLEEKIEQRYYKKRLPFFLGKGFYDDVEIAKQNIKNRSRRDNILFFLYSFPLGRTIFKIVYELHLEHYRKHPVKITSHLR